MLQVRWAPLWGRYLTSTAGPGGLKATHSVWAIGLSNHDAAEVDAAERTGREAGLKWRLSLLRRDAADVIGNTVRIVQRSGSRRGWKRLAALRGQIRTQTVHPQPVGGLDACVAGGYRRVLPRSTRDRRDAHVVPGSRPGAERRPSSRRVRAVSVDHRHGPDRASTRTTDAGTRPAGLRPSHRNDDAQVRPRSLRDSAA